MRPLRPAVLQTAVLVLLPLLIAIASSAPHAAAQTAIFVNSTADPPRTTILPGFKRRSSVAVTAGMLEG